MRAAPARELRAQLASRSVKSVPAGVDASAATRRASASVAARDRSRLSLRSRLSSREQPASSAPQIAATPAAASRQPRNDTTNGSALAAGPASADARPSPTLRFDTSTAGRSAPASAVSMAVMPGSGTRSSALQFW